MTLPSDSQRWRSVVIGDDIATDTQWSQVIGIASRLAKQQGLASSKKEARAFLRESSVTERYVHSACFLGTASVSSLTLSWFQGTEEAPEKVHPIRTADSKQDCSGQWARRCGRTTTAHAHECCLQLEHTVAAIARSDERRRHEIRCRFSHAFLGVETHGASVCCSSACSSRCMHSDERWT